MSATQTHSTGGPTRFACAAAAVLVGTFVLSSCGTFKNENRRQRYDGFIFSAKSKPVDKKTDLENFTVEVKRASQSRTGAGKAGHHEGTKYCIENFGPHKIEWAVHPLDQVDDLQIVNDVLSLRGTCVS
ncbi:hypothetical protein QEZ52_14490 [Aliisedimentitalea scapharcae]|uniref:Lipoprotein n=1 Tax=Aliisedimentitalea scapharcae TaxID=1524259 RepID=A0ABZ2XQ23_9RHOB